MTNPQNISFGVVALSLLFGASCVRFQAALGTQSDEEGNHSIAEYGKGPDPAEWEYANSLQTALDNAKTTLTYANNTANFLGSLLKNDKVKNQLLKLGSKGAGALKALEKAGKVAEKFTKALEVLDAVSGVAGLLGLLPIVESPEDQVNRKLDEIIESVKELREEVKQGISDIQKQNYNLAKAIIEGAVTQHYVNKLVQLESDVKIGRIMHAFDDGDDVAVKKYIDKLLENTELLQNAILGLGMTKPLFDLYYDEILEAFKPGNTKEDVAQMLDMLMLLTMKFSEYMSLQTQSVDILGKFMLRLNEMGRSDLAKSYADSLTALVDNIRVQQTTHDPMIKPAVKATLNYAFAEEDFLFHLGNVISRVCYNAARESPMHGSVPSADSVSNAAWEVAETSNFNRDEMWNFGHICMERGNFRRCQLRGEGDCDRFKKKYGPMSHWMIHKRKALTQARFEKYLEMADRFTENGHWSRMWIVEQNKYFAGGFGLAGRWEWKEGERALEEGNLISKQLIESLF